MGLNKRNRGWYICRQKIKDTGIRSSVQQLYEPLVPAAGIGPEKIRFCRYIYFGTTRVGLVFPPPSLVPMRFQQANMPCLRKISCWFSQDNALSPPFK
jgi:hypothetical protein